MLALQMVYICTYSKLWYLYLTFLTVPVYCEQLDHCTYCIVETITVVTQHFYLQYQNEHTDWIKNVSTRALTRFSFDLT